MTQTEPNWQMLGHEWAVGLLRSHITREQTRHAYLFTGPQRVGRRTLALRMAQALNCAQPPVPGEACGTCRACRLIETQQYPDLWVVEAESGSANLKIDQIRALQRTLSLAPYEARHKIALLLRFEEANPNAANALLKTLEEPPAQVILLLTASDAETLLPTIVSRCEVIRLRPLPIAEVSEGLQTRWGVPAPEAQLLAHLSNGRPGHALHLWENPDLLTRRQNWLEDHRKLLGASRGTRFSYAEEIAKDRAALLQMLQTWLTLWRDAMLRAGGSTAPLTNLDITAEIETLASHVGLQTARNMVVHLEKAIEQTERYINARLVAEVLMLNLPHLRARLQQSSF